jgi:ATP synthase protein I
MTEEPEEDRRAAQTHAAAWSITSYLLSGMLVYGGLGWLIDKLVGTSGVFLPIGLIGGMFASLWLVYIRFGRS